MISSLFVGIIKFLLCVILQAINVLVSVTLLLPFLVALIVAALIDFGGTEHKYTPMIFTKFLDCHMPVENLQSKIIRFKLK